MNEFFSFVPIYQCLSRCRLWNTAALVVKLSQCESVQLRFDVYPTHCNLCSRALQRRGWLCDSCKTITNTCSLCHLVVRGLYVWCRGIIKWGITLQKTTHLKETLNSPWDRLFTRWSFTSHSRVVCPEYGLSNWMWSCLWIWLKIWRVTHSIYITWKSNLRWRFKSWFR